MAQLTREELKLLFENGDIPTQEDFANLIDSLALKSEISTSVGYTADWNVRFLNSESYSINSEIDQYGNINLTPNINTYWSGGGFEFDSDNILHFKESSNTYYIYADDCPNMTGITTLDVTIDSGVWIDIDDEGYVLEEEDIVTLFNYDANTNHEYDLIPDIEQDSFKLNLLIPNKVLEFIRHPDNTNSYDHARLNIHITTDNGEIDQSIILTDFTLTDSDDQSVIADNTPWINNTIKGLNISRLLTNL